MNKVNLSELAPVISSSDVDPFWHYYSDYIRGVLANQSVIRSILHNLEDHVRGVHCNIKTPLLRLMAEQYHEQS